MNVVTWNVTNANNERQQQSVNQTNEQPTLATWPNELQEKVKGHNARTKPTTAERLEPMQPN